MLTRRGFLSFLACVPVLGRIVPQGGTAFYNETLEYGKTPVVTAMRFNEETCEFEVDRADWIFPIYPETPPHA
jgi:hypothetical protein